MNEHILTSEECELTENETEKFSVSLDDINISSPTVVAFDVKKLNFLFPFISEFYDQCLLATVAQSPPLVCTI